MFKKILLAGLLVSASAPAWAQAGQLGANQILGNPTSGSKNGVPANIGLFLTPGTGVTVTGTPKATIGLANQVTAAGPMGSATQTIVLTFNAQGQITAATLATIAPPFSAITGSLACSQEPARTGDVTAPAGSCVNTAVKLNGVAFGTSPSVDTVPVVTTSNTAIYTAIPNCTSGGLQYSTATHLFSCGSAGTGNVSTSGSPAANQAAYFTSSTAITGAAGAVGQHFGVVGSTPTFKSGGWELLNTLTASNSATLSDTTSLTSTYAEYEIVFEDFLAATSSTTCEIQVHSSGSYQTTGYLSSDLFGASATGNNQATTFIYCGVSGSNSNSLPMNTTIRVNNPSATGLHTWTGFTTTPLTTAAWVGVVGGLWNTSAAIDGFQVLMSSGNITSGKVKIYGRL